MELPTTQARRLMGTKFPWIDQIVTGELPHAVAGNADQTICRISEWLNEPTYYANAKFKGWTIGVEVQIFYKKDSGISTLNGEIQLAQLFKADGWTIEQSKNHIQDPDTGQVTKVFYFAKDLVIKESELNGRNVS